MGSLAIIGLHAKALLGMLRLQRAGANMNQKVAIMANRVAGVALMAVPLVFALGYFDINLFGITRQQLVARYLFIAFGAALLAHIATGVTGSNLNSTFVQDGVLPLMRFPAGVIGRYFSHRAALREMALVSEPATWDKTKILPRLKHQDFLESASQLLKGLGDGVREQLPVTNAFCGDMLVSYSLDVGEKYISVNQAQIRQLGMNPRQLHELAIDNLRRELQGKIDFHRMKTFMVLACKVDSLTASSVLLPEVCEAAEKFAGAKGLRFMIPRPDMVALVSPAQTGQIDGLALNAEQCFTAMVVASRDAATEAAQMAISYNPVEYRDGVWHAVVLPAS
jgi:hypothetical protein